MEKQLIARMGKEHSNDFDDKPFLELLFVTKYMNNLISLVICAFLFCNDKMKWIIFTRCIEDATSSLIC